VHGRPGGSSDSGHGVGEIHDDKADFLNNATPTHEEQAADDLEWQGAEAARPEAEFEGYWFHELQPDMVEFIQGCQILSYDGTVTKLKPSGSGSFFIRFQGRKMYARHEGDKLSWDDGDIWMRKREGGSNTKGGKEAQSSEAIPIRQHDQRSKAPQRRGVDVVQLFCGSSVSTLCRR